jgi:uncharacterized protein YegJ (DUF2314 family)
MRHMAAPVYYRNESELAGAAALARSTFRLFWREMSWEYRRIVPAYGIACVKLAFEEDGRVEHMWVSEVQFDGETLRGTLLNAPDQIRNVHEGDAVTVPLGPRLSDWMLASERGVMGAYTVQAIRSKMGEQERVEHDAAWDLDFGNPDLVAIPPDGDDHPMALNMLPSLQRFLQQRPVEATQLGEDGLGMLHREALAGNNCVVAALLAHGVPPNARTKAGKTALSLARVLGWPKVEARLVEAGGTE